MFIALVSLMPTREIRFFVENILNKGNMLGLDRASLDVYLVEGIRSDEEPNVLLQVDSYTIFGGFLEALILKMIYDARDKGIGGVDWVIGEYSSFVENIKDYEKEILRHTKRYFEKINNIADALRTLGMKVKVHLSEISSGIELYLAGRYEVIRDHMTRKVNELSAEGVGEIVVISPFEYSLYEKGYLSQIPTWTMKLRFFADVIRKSGKDISAINKVKVAIFDPYRTPVMMFRQDLRGEVISAINKIEEILGSIKNLEIIDKKYDGAPIGYEQLWMINPVVAVDLSKDILESYAGRADIIITARTSTAMILNVAKEIYGVDIKIYEYSDLISKLMLGMEI